MSKSSLYELMSFEKSRMTVLEESSVSGAKNLFMKGIFIQGDVRNHNKRIYPTREISRAVNLITEKIKNDNGVGGEMNHPEDLAINPERISHIITEMWLEGNDGYGKLKIVPTPLGNIVKTLLESGLKLGVSSRGSGNVDDDGVVSDFEIVTVDIVTQPSAPNAYPRVIYESLYNMRGGSAIIENARTAHFEPSAQRELNKQALKFIEDLKVKI